MNPLIKAGYHEISVNFAILKWESIGTGYYLDGTVANFFGVDPVSYTHLDVYKRQALHISLQYHCNSFAVSLQ